MTENVVQIWSIKTPDPETDGSDSITNLRELLVQEEKERADRFLRDRDRNRFIARRAALRFLLSRYDGNDVHSIKFVANEFGKPSLRSPQRHANLEFSSSSSGDRAIIAFAVNQPIGIDIETMDRRVNLHDLSKRFFHPDECDEINAQPDDQQRKAFFNCWTRKEAYIKALGKGLYLPLDSFCVSVGDESPKLLWRDQSTEDQVAWQIDSFHPQKDYVVALFRPSDLTSVERFTFSLDS